MLVSMEIAPGTRIGIDAVARKLGISQTPIREALSRLEAEKLVIKVPNVGSHHASAQMTPAEVSDLYVLRQLIEPYAAARAAESMNDETLRQLSAMEEEMDRIQAETGVAYARFAEADAMLHSLVATGSGNHLIAETIERLHMHLHIFRFLFNTNAPQEAAQEHAEIIHALLARDPAAAETAMRVHLERSRIRMEEASVRIAARVPAEPRTAGGPAASCNGLVGVTPAAIARCSDSGGGPAQRGLSVVARPCGMRSIAINTQLIKKHVMLAQDRASIDVDQVNRRLTPCRNDPIKPSLGANELGGSSAPCNSFSAILLSSSSTRPSWRSPSCVTEAIGRRRERRRTRADLTGIVRSDRK